MTVRTGLTLALTVVAIGAAVPMADTSLALAKARHDLAVSAEEVGGDGTDKFRVYGTVATFKGRKVEIQKKVNQGGWELWKKSETSAEDGAFSERIYGGKVGSKVCYKVVVPSTQQYRTTKKRAACITTD